MKKKTVSVCTLVVLCSTVALSGMVSPGWCSEKSAKGESTDKKKGSSEKRKVKDKKKSMTIYEFKAKALDGTEISLDKYKGEVVLIVNTASECGFTPQYAGLEELHKKYSGKGLQVLGFPCNQFGGQEPGDNNHIATFCKRNYGVEFQMFDKVDVNGKDAHPLYKYLTSAAPGALGTDSIKWNFTKFLIARDGTVIKRYAPTVKPEDLAGDIEKQL